MPMAIRLAPQGLILGYVYKLGLCSSVVLLCCRGSVLKGRPSSLSLGVSFVFIGSVKWGCFMV